MKTVNTKVNPDLWREFKILCYKNNLEVWKGLEVVLIDVIKSKGKNIQGFEVGR